MEASAKGNAISLASTMPSNTISITNPRDNYSIKSLIVVFLGSLMISIGSMSTQPMFLWPLYNRVDELWAALLSSIFLVVSMGILSNTWVYIWLSIGSMKHDKLHKVSQRSLQVVFQTLTQASVGEGPHSSSSITQAPAETV